MTARDIGRRPPPSADRLLRQGRLFTSVGRFNGYILLRVGSYDAHSEGKHDDYFSHYFWILVVIFIVFNIFLGKA